MQELLILFRMLYIFLKVVEELEEYSSFFEVLDILSGCNDQVCAFKRKCFLFRGVLIVGKGEGPRIIRR